MTAAADPRVVARAEKAAPRFGFGENWSNFSTHVDAARVHEARDSIASRLGDIAGLRFLDAGCGSGLFSLAAVQLKASPVHSFDFDEDSVTTSWSLKQRFSPETSGWRIERGDVLDRAYLDALGQWDIVYSWGVLHHTGNMRRAWENIAGTVAPGGHLFISIYNDQGLRSRAWSAIKRQYQRVPVPLRPLYVLLVMGPRETLSALAQGPAAYLRAWQNYRSNRGMSRWHDLVDWVGGYPFEVAKPDHVFDFFRERGFTLEWMLTCGAGLGCNQFVFRRSHEA